jgi:nucleoside-diphosphate-sugar epimerase
MTKNKILITGACGQIGTILTKALRERYGHDQVICSDILPKSSQPTPYYELDVRDVSVMREILEKEQINTVYHMAALLSATGEKDIRLTWDINLNAWLNLMDLALQTQVEKIFFPSTIAVFGLQTPRIETPQYTNLTPGTVYGMSKAAGENWANYYFQRYKLDIRSIRYPGIISWDSQPGGGTTDYAVEIFHEALKTGSYCSYIDEHTRLPMMYMPDAIKATIELMEAPIEQIKVRTSYNLTAFSFSPGSLAKNIQKYIPDFQITYKPDFRQKIAESWPESIDDQDARQDWNWSPDYSMDDMVKDIITNLKSQKNEQTN